MHTLKSPAIFYALNSLTIHLFAVLVAQSQVAGGRRVTRGVVPALNAELEQLMSTAPVAPMEGWSSHKKSPAADELEKIVTWESWQSRLKEERVPGYVIRDLWHTISEIIRSTATQASSHPLDVPRTLTCGEQPGSSSTTANSAAGTAQADGTLDASAGVSWEELLRSVNTDLGGEDLQGLDGLHFLETADLLGGAAASGTEGAAAAAATEAAPPPTTTAAAAASSSSSSTSDDHIVWARDLCSRLKRLLTLGRTPINFGQLYYLLMGTLAGHTRRLQAATTAPAASSGGSNGGGANASENGGAPMSKEEVMRSNLAHHAIRRAEWVSDLILDDFLTQCKRTARNLRLDVPLAGSAVELRRTLRSLMEVGHYREYEVMTKEALNELTGQRELWSRGEQDALLDSLCTRDGKTWITHDFFRQHTSRNASELYVLVHLPTLQIVGLSAVADFQTPWTAGQFHHMAHACQEDRMFFLGRKSERDIAPKIALDKSASFEGGTRWTSHFHMPTLLAVDIICAKPGVRGLAQILLAHITCLTSSFTSDRTHVLFDISGREKNTRMVKFCSNVGAVRCQTFTDEARSEGYVGVEGDDPSIYWTYKERDGYGPNDGTHTHPHHNTQLSFPPLPPTALTSHTSTHPPPTHNTGKTAGVYAVDEETGESIWTEHPAVLFNDRVTLADFHRGTKNCSYFAVAPLEIAQSKLIGLLTSLRERALQEAAEASGADPSAAAGLVEKPWQQQQASSPAGAAEAGGGGDGGGELVKEVKEEAAVMAS